MAEQGAGEGSRGLTQILSLGRPVFEEKPFDPRPIRETTRSKIAIRLVWLLVLVSAALIGLTAAGLLTIDESKDLAGAVLSPIIAVTGTALGFYYGGHGKADS
jgi:hypothetical protein